MWLSLLVELQSSERIKLNLSIGLNWEPIHLSALICGNCSKAFSKSKAVISCFELIFHSRIFVEVHFRQRQKKRRRNKQKTNHECTDRMIYDILTDAGALFIFNPTCFFQPSELNTKSILQSICSIRFYLLYHSLL